MRDSTSGQESAAGLRPKLLEHIRTVQELLGQASVETTMVYTHVMNRGGRGVRSPLDRQDNVLVPEQNRHESQSTSGHLK
jgi:integrase